MTTQPNVERHCKSALVIAALGVVYGDIGTSPLYALRECFGGNPNMPLTPDNIKGVLSLIFWALTLIVSIKYLTFVLRADNKGEGGILALMSLAFPERRPGGSGAYKMWAVALGVFGAALLYGDGMITPVITVLGAVEGLKVATPIFEPYIVPITVALLVALFSVQRLGTGQVGRVFGPISLTWFVTMAVLGVRGIMQAPEVLAAVNPLFAADFLVHHGWTGIVVLSLVFLVLTGAEALYADLGHFGRGPIRRAWFLVVFPSLILNYLGQGALLLRNPEALTNPFYLLAPSWALYPLVGLATAASIIASQALIAGAFSLTMQAIQLGYCPRMTVDHMSSSKRGQIYLPHVNWMLMLACVGLTIGFGSSTKIASAYGMAVNLDMLITSVLLCFVARYVWGWSLWRVCLMGAVFLGVELAFFSANFLKILHGGWFPLAIGACIYTLMSTWKQGRRILGKRLENAVVGIDVILRSLALDPPARVAGTAVFLSGNLHGTPVALLHNLKHNKVLHQRNLILTMLVEEAPYVDAHSRLAIEELSPEFYRVIGRYGFMEDPNVLELLHECKDKGLVIKIDDSTFFLSRESIIPSKSLDLASWRKRIFAIMSRNAQSATTFFRLPANRVVELGLQVEL